MTNNQNTAATDRAENDNSGKLAGTGAGVIADDEFKAAKAKLLGL